MPSVNKATIIGHLGKDPEVRHTPSGTAICNFSIATSERYKDKSGETQERTEWHNIVVMGKSAERAGEWLAKGALCYVEGRIQTRKWQGKDGQDRYITEIVALDFKPLNPKKSPADAAKTDMKRGGSGVDDMDDDVPWD